MLDYEAFRNYVKEHVTSHMPEKYENADVRINKVNKTNCEKYAVTINSDGESTILPNVYLDYYFEQYLDGSSLEEVTGSIAIDYCKALDKSVNMPGNVTSIYTEWNLAKERIVFDMIGTAQNEERLQDVPHRDILDVSAVYRVIITDDEQGISSTIITNDILEKYGVTEQELYEVAYKNTQEFYKPYVRPMFDILSGMGVFEEFPDMDQTEMETDVPLFVIGNEKAIAGATNLLFDDILQKAAERVCGSEDMDSDREIFIIPSSRHELLALNKKGNDPRDIQLMVEEVNMTQVVLQDRLSNNVYGYNMDTHELYLATDVPNRMLDGTDLVQDMAKTI